MECNASLIARKAYRSDPDIVYSQEPIKPGP